MGVMSGILMIGTFSYEDKLDYLGVAIIVVGVGLIVKKQYIDVSYWLARLISLYFGSDYLLWIYVWSLWMWIFESYILYNWY